MIVSEEVRLTSMISALTGTIVPALEGNPFALEQAALVIGHLHVLRAHLDYSDEYEKLEHLHARGLARELVELSEGGVKTSSAVAEVQTLLAAAVSTRIGEVRTADRQLSSAVAALIEAQGQDGTAACLSSSSRAVLTDEFAQSIRDRSYFAPFGYEDGVRSIPALDAMMIEFRRQTADQEKSAIN